jgi:protoporphyrinogen/coproporphyrinogen III oxidase
VRVLVVGGGITGLAAAHALGKAGVPTLLLEATERLGGKVATEHVDGFTIEAGPDSFVGYRPAAVELCRELGIGGDLMGPQEPRVVHVRAGGRFARLPDGMGLVLPTRMLPFVTTDLFSWPQKLRMGLDLLLPREVVTDDIAVGAFLQRRLGQALVDRLAGPLIGGVYGTDIDDLSLDAVVPMLRDAERKHRSLLLASLADGRARRAGGRKPGSPFVALRGGIGQLTEALASAAQALPSVEVRTGTAVRSLALDGPRVRLTLPGGEQVIGDAIVVAAPAPVAASLLDAEVPAAATHLRSIPHGSTAVVTLGYAPGTFPADLEGHGFLVAGGERLTINAGTLSSRKWADRAPDGALLVRAFIGAGRASATATDDELVAAARRDFGTTLGLRSEPIVTRVARYRDAMPHYTVGHLDRVAAANAALSETPQVVLAGGAYRGVGLPDCIAQGQAAAARLGHVLGRVAPEASTSGAAAHEVAVPEPAVPARIRALAELPDGMAAAVATIDPADAEELSFEGIGLGSRVEITTRAPLGGPVVVRTGRARVALPRRVASSVAVHTVDGPP